MKNYCYIHFKSKISNVVFARGVLVSFLVDLDLNLHFVNEMKTIISEAVTNAMVHGYNGDESKDVYLKLEITVQDELIITVIDEGKGIADIKKAREPLYTTKIEEERAGLGFTIMDIFSDNLKVESKVNKGTTITCRKFLKFNNGNQD